MSRGVGQERVARAVLAAVLVAQAGLVGLHVVWAPGWPFVNLGREANLPTWFHAGLLVAVALLALDALRLEARLLGRAGRGRGWALTWLAVAGAFVYLALDEGLAIHEWFYTVEVYRRFRSVSPLRLVATWIFVFLPAIVGGVAFLLAMFGARARLSGRLMVWGGGGLALWVSAVALEAIARSFFEPRGLYWLEVILEETAESLGTTCFGWAIWRYRAELRTWLGAAAATALPGFVVPWRWVAVGTLALAVPGAVVGAAVARNLHVLERFLGDDHLRAGRLDEAVRSYRAVVAVAPDYASAWNALAAAEFRRGNLEAAVRAFAEVERLDPRRAQPVRNRGTVLLLLGRPADAVDALTRAVALDPSDAGAHRHLGWALRGLGREEEARAVLARADALRAEKPRANSLRQPAGEER